MNRRHESFHDVYDMAAPPLFAEQFYAAFPDVTLIGALLVSEMAKFHRDYHPVGNQRRAETGAEANEKHQSLLVTAQRLHRGVVDNLDRPGKGALKIKSNPSST